jgi:hypothetical protein
MVTTALSFVGPPTPDLYRRQVGRFGDRHYVDPLPADDVWPALNDDLVGPSVSTIKKAWPFYAAKKWAAETVAEWAYDNVDGWRGFDRPTAVKLLADQADHSLNRAGKRGTEVHTILEELAAGREQILVEPPAELYLDACRLVIAELKPRWIAAETVVISRSLGYGGTFDAVGLVEIDGLGPCIVDWKSRKPGKNGAYPEEAAQIAAYASADYMIIAGPDGNAVRAPIPPVEHGLIVSIDPSGYEAHRVELEPATETWRALHAFWTAQRTNPTRLVRASQVADRKEIEWASAPTPASPERRAGIVERIKQLQPKHLEEMATRWPYGVPTLKQSDAHSDAELDAIEQVLTSIDWHPDRPVPERPAPAPEPELPPAAVWTVDEGADLDEATYAAAKDLYETIEPVLRTQVDAWAREAHAAGRTFSLRNRATLRRSVIMRAAIELSPYEADVVEAAINLVIPMTGSGGQFTIGYLLGSLTLEEAHRLYAIAEAIGTTVAVIYGPNGVTFDGLTAVA